jgi:hypothetical protein
MSGIQVKKLVGRTPVVSPVTGQRTGPHSFLTQAALRKGRTCS